MLGLSFTLPSPDIRHTPIDDWFMTGGLPDFWAATYTHGRFDFKIPTFVYLKIVMRKFIAVDRFGWRPVNLVEAAGRNILCQEYTVEWYVFQNSFAKLIDWHIRNASRPVSSPEVLRLDALRIACIIKHGVHDDLRITSS